MALRGALGPCAGMGGSRFHLTKWYLDAVADDGSAVLCYWLRMQWHCLVLHGASVVEVPADPGQPVQQRSRWMRSAGPAPELRGLQVVWDSPAAGVHGVWQGSSVRSASAPGVQHALLQDGTLDWHCYVPGGRVHALAEGGSQSLPNPAALCGRQAWGYAECLHMTLVPWRLPVQELRWGRAVNAGGSVVWIDWRGPRPQSLVWVNGVLMRGGRIQDADLGQGAQTAVVQWQGGQVQLTVRRVIRSGALGQAALHQSPAAAFTRVRGKAARRFLDTHEQKWLCDARMPDGSHAYAVHEVVHFSTGAPKP